MAFIPLQKGIVYGPVSSKRLGRSFGINLSPKGRKICTYNCVYCFYGPTESHTSSDHPSPDAVFVAVEKGLRSIGKIDYITFAGNGEPTLHPHFEEIVAGVRRLRDELRPNIPIALLSNATRLSDDSVRRAIGSIDLPVMKLDAADDQTFKEVNRPLLPIRVSDIVDSLSDMNIVIQTVAVCGSVTNIAPERMERYLALLEKIAPKEVQLYTLDEPMKEKSIIPCTVERLRRIAFLAKKKSIKLTLYE